MSTNGVIIPGYPTTTARGLVLIFDGLTLSITQFGSFPSQYPRLDASYTSISTTLRGNTSRQGTQFRPKSLWTFDAYLTLEQHATWARMEASFLDAPGPFTLHDYTKPFAENGTRTRGLAPNSTADSTGGKDLYYASFNAEPVRAVQMVETNATGDLFSFQFQETEATSA